NSVKRPVHFYKNPLTRGSRSMKDETVSPSKPPSFVPHNSDYPQGIRLVLRSALYLILIGAIGIAAYSAFRLVQERAHVAELQEHLATSRGLIQPVRKRLAAEFSDKDGRLLADPPTDPQQLLDPDALVLAHYVDAEEETQLIDWDDLK